MGFFDKISSVFNDIGSKISGASNFIAHKIPAVKSAIDVGKGILNTASNFAQSDTAKALASVIPYGEQVRQGVIKTNDIVNKGANLFNAVADTVQNINSQINKNSDPNASTPSPNPKDVVESIVQPSSNPNQKFRSIDDEYAGKGGKGNLEK